jgi:hypothetical protein
MATIVLGAAFGDEGKGKLVDILCQNVQFCARAQVRNWSANARDIPVMEGSQSPGAQADDGFSFLAF